MDKITFTIYGKAQAQQRAGERVTASGHIHHYDQDESKSAKKEIKDTAFHTVKGKWPQFDCPVNLAVKELRAIPKSWSAKKKTAALQGEVRPTSKPDLKNLIWLVEDCLNGLMWVDDSRIVSFDGSGKWYSALPPCTIIEITAL